MDYTKILLALVFSVILISSAQGCCCCCPCCCRCRHQQKLRLILQGKRGSGRLAEAPIPTGTTLAARDATTTVSPRTATAPTKPPRT